MVRFLVFLALISQQGKSFDIDWRAISYLEEADYFHQLGLLYKADSILNLGIERTKSPILYKELAKLKLEEDSTKKAFDIAKSLLKWGDAPEVYSLILEAAAQIDKDTAVKWARKAIKKFPQNAELLAKSARIFDYYDKKKEAKKIYSKLLEMVPDSFRIKADYASFLLREGLVDSALTLYEEIYDSLRGNYRVELGYGRVLEKKGNIEEALKHYIRAQNSNPQNFGLLLKVAQLYLKLNKLEEALKVLDGAKGVFYFEPSVRQLRGITLYRLERYYEAADELLVASSLNPKDPENPYYLARIFYALGDHKRALKYIDIALSIDEKRTDFLVYKSFLLVTINRIDEAIKVLKKVKDKDPYVLSVKGHAYLMAEKPKKAEKYFRKALLMEPENPQRYIDLSDALSKEGKKESAIEILREGERRFENNRGIMFRLAELYSDLGKVDSAIFFYRNLALLDSTDATVLNNWGYLLVVSGRDLQLAKELIERALSIEPDNPIYLDSMGWLYFKLGDYERAYEYINKAVSMGIDDAEVLEHMGDILEKLGKKYKAKTYWKKALEKDPKNERLLKKLGFKNP